MSDTEGKQIDTERTDRRRRGGAGGGNVVYAFGFFGALVFYIQQADGFWQGALGILKAFIWPAFLVYELLKFVTAG